MHPVLLMGLLLWSAGRSKAMVQELTCPYHAADRCLPRVWCKQSSFDCCVGLSFEYQSTLNVDQIQTREYSGSFVISVSKLADENGVYWCGLLANGTAIIKLAERYFFSSTSEYIWSRARWGVLPFILALSFLVSYYIQRRKHHVDTNISRHVSSTQVLEERDPTYLNEQESTNNTLEPTEDNP